MTLRLQDCDTGESMLEVYEVPEGICITLGAADENTEGDENLYYARSCILSPRDAALLLEYLSMHRAVS